jgi:hypothetical protein
MNEKLLEKINEKISEYLKLKVELVYEETVDDWDFKNATLKTEIATKEFSSLLNKILIIGYAGTIVTSPFTQFEFIEEIYFPNGTYKEVRLFELHIGENEEVKIKESNLYE